MNYQSLKELLIYIDEPNRSACLNLLKDHQERIEVAPGSLVKHQAWKGGYIGHLEEVMNLAVAFYKIMNEFRPLPFTVSDAILVLFLHDLEKPFRYVEPKQEFYSDKEKKEFIDGMIKKYGIVLNSEHQNGLKYIHGEGEDYSRTENIQKPLAAFVHMCDTASARIWPDHPKR